MNWENVVTRERLIGGHLIMTERNIPIKGIITSLEQLHNGGARVVMTECAGLRGPQGPWRIFLDQVSTSFQWNPQQNPEDLGEGIVIIEHLDRIGLLVPKGVDCDPQKILRCLGLPTSI